MTRLTDSPMVLPYGDSVDVVRDYFGVAETATVPLTALQGFLADLCSSDEPVAVFSGVHVHSFEKQSLIAELRMYKMMWEDGDWDEDGPIW